MNAKPSQPASPIPVHKKLTRWQEWREVVYFAFFVLGTSILMWHLPHTIHPYLAALLALGFLFDARSAFYYTLSFIKRCHMSGFPLIGFIFYFWAWLAYPKSVLIAGAEGFWQISLQKIPDLLALAACHALFHVPFYWLFRVTKREIRQGQEESPLTAPATESPPR